MEWTFVTGDCELARCALPSQVRAGMDTDSTLPFTNTEDLYFFLIASVFAFLELPGTEKWGHGGRKT